MQQNNKIVYNIAIIGAGPAGAVFAKEIAQSHPELKIILIDASEKYNLSIACFDYDVIFGAYKDMSKKFGYIELMEKDAVVKEREGVVLDVSNPEDATIKFKK